MIRYKFNQMTDGVNVTASTTITTTTTTSTSTTAHGLTIESSINPAHSHTATDHLQLL